MIILSIPYLNDEFVIQNALKCPKYWQEFRLDYSQKPFNFPIKLINENTIITLRSSKEGGMNDVNLEDKIRFYQELISKKKCLYDLEIDELSKGKITEIPASNLVLSYHDFSEKTDLHVLEEIINKSNSINSAFLKIAVTISSYSELNTIGYLIKLSKKPVIFAGMGKLGKISRILYKHLGAEATFAGLAENPTAAGQLSPKEVELYKLRSISKQTQIGGIIGGTQIENSLGLEHYNDLFQKKQLNAVYLPFITDDIDDLWNWIGTSKIHFYGFSITMPFKKLIAEKLECDIANLYLPKTGEMLNSDKQAFKRSLEILDINRDDSILIFGSGSTAEAFLQILKTFNIVIISSRNETAGNKLAKKFNREFEKSQDISTKKFDLLLNCTPLGSQNQDILKLLKLPLPVKVIDLPYIQKNTLLISKCIENEVDHIDGKSFWKLQSEIQQKKFLSAISNPEV